MTAKQPKNPEPDTTDDPEPDTTAKDDGALAKAGGRTVYLPVVRGQIKTRHESADEAFEAAEAAGASPDQVCVIPVLVRE